MNTHKLLPGVLTGDIGPKFAFDQVDNGFLMLNHVRIPRFNMLMRYAEILPDGTFKEASSQAKQLGYGSMLLTRLNIAIGCGI